MILVSHNKGEKNNYECGFHLIDFALRSGNVYEINEDIYFLIF